MSKILLSLAILAGVVLVASPASANVLQVGPGKPFAKPCAAILAAAPGDIIEIDSTGNYNGDVCAWTTNNLTIRGIGPGRAVVNAAGNNSQGKGIWVIAGNNTTVENIEFTGAAVPDMNGAGIRQEGTSLTVRNCYFHDNQEGILAGDDPNSTILVEFSEFARNGSGDGFTHNIYVTHIAKFIFRYNYSHAAIVGHLVKSRAAENQILYNRLSGESGTGSYEIDLPNGGKSYVIGNLIEQGPQTENSAILSYLEEGSNPSNPDRELFVINNTFVNDFSSGTFVFVDPSAVPAVIRNNIFTGPGALTNQGSAILATNFVGDAKLADLANVDYHLQASSPAIDAGSDPGVGAAMSLLPASQYVHPACAEGRVTVGAKIDIGAYEFGGGAGTASAGAPSRCSTTPPPPAPAVSLSAASLPFGNQAVSTTSAAQEVTLTNSGTAALSIASIAITGANSSDFAQTNTCGSSVAAGANCSVSVTFAPAASGNRSAMLSITDNAAGSPHTVALSGTGVVPASGVTLSPSSLSFTGQMVGTTSAAKTVTLTNGGSAALSVTSIVVTGANSSDFAQTNACGSSVAAGANCSISVSFQPAAGGSRSATLTVTDSAAGSPHTAGLSGTGMDFSLSTSPGLATINAGQSTSFTLTVSPAGGFNQSISLACTGAPKAATCSVSPSSIPPGSGVSSATVSITTTARSLTFPEPRVLPPYLGWRIVVLLASTTLIFFAVAWRRRVRLGLAVALLLFLVFSGCSGAVSQNSPSPPPAGTGTPAGAYSLTVTATSAGVAHATTFSLTVM